MNSRALSHPDILIIGAGVIGLSIAYEACRTGAQVCVLERHHIGSGATGVAAGMLAPVSESEHEEPCLLALALESCRIYPDWVHSLEIETSRGCGYRTDGSLLVALHRDHEAELKHLAAFQHKLGLSTVWLSAGEVLEREPCLSPRVIGGLFAEGDRQVDPRRLSNALAEAIERRGGRIIPQAHVTSVLSASGHAIGVVFRHGNEQVKINAAAVVIACGAWANALLPAEHQLPSLRPVKGQALRLRHALPMLRSVVRTPDVYLVPREHGELVIGATMEEQGFDNRPTAGAVLDMLRESSRVLPGIYDLEIAELGVGFRPALRDHLPVIGPAGLPGLFLAVGHYRHGVMLASATAQLLVPMLQGGEVPALLAPFQASRFPSAVALQGITA